MAHSWIGLSAASIEDSTRLRHSIHTRWARREPLAAIVEHMGGSEDLLGTVVANRYRLDKVLGEGGFGAVYVAAREDGVQVALKVLFEDALERTGGDDRFRREAELARRLDHPNVVKVLDEGIDARGTRFIAFELLTGRTLGDEIGRWGAMRPQRAAQIALRVLHALEAAHGVGIIHRDLKPANIFLMHGDDRLKVLDFGIAKSINKNTIAGLTQAGQVLGTPAYMAIEQLTGDPVAPATDLFALGVVLIEMLIGRPPYPSGSTAMDIVRSRLTGLALELPGDLLASPLGQIALRATRAHPRERYANVGAMRSALEAALLLPEMNITAVSPHAPAAPAPLAPTGVSGPAFGGPAPGGAVFGAQALGGQARPPGHLPLGAHALTPMGGVSGFTQIATRTPPPASPPRLSSQTGGIMWAAAVVGGLVLAGIGVGLWVSAGRADAAAASANDDAELADDDATPERKKRKKRRRRRAKLPQREPAQPPPDGPPRPRAPPIPAAVTTRVMPCRGAATQNEVTLRSHVSAIGWRVGGTLVYCAGNMVNFRCSGGQGRGVTAAKGSEKGSAAVVRFNSASAAKRHAESQRGKSSPAPTTWATDGRALLYVQLPDAEADKLMARICR